MEYEYKNEQLRKLQLKELEIFTELVALCEAEQLQYFAIAGTALGAVRHKGMIPWDDDIDIALPRKDYEKFLEIAPQKLPPHLKLEFAKIAQFHRVLNVHTHIQVDPVVTDGQGTDYHLFCDIFPIDGMPSSKFGRWLHMTHYLILRMVFKFHFIQFIATGEHRPAFENFIIKTAKALRFYKLVPYEFMSKRLRRCEMKYSYETSSFCSIFPGPYRYKDMYPKSCFGEGVKLPFEGISVTVPADYDHYLKAIYGDYMKIVVSKPHLTSFEERENGHV